MCIPFPKVHDLMPGLERLISFTIFGLFIFSPLINSWQSMRLVDFYPLYAVWIALIVLCAISQRDAIEPESRNQDYDL